MSVRENGFEELVVLNRDNLLRIFYVKGKKRNRVIFVGKEDQLGKDQWLGLEIRLWGKFFVLEIQQGCYRVVI